MALSRIAIVDQVAHEANLYNGEWVMIVIPFTTALDLQLRVAMIDTPPQVQAQRVGRLPQSDWLQMSIASDPLSRKLND